MPTRKYRPPPKAGETGHYTHRNRFEHYASICMTSQRLQSGEIDMEDVYMVIGNQQDQEHEDNSLRSSELLSILHNQHTLWLLGQQRRIAIMPYAEDNRDVPGSGGQNPQFDLPFTPQGILEALSQRDPDGYCELDEALLRVSIPQASIALMRFMGLSDKDSEYQVTKAVRERIEALRQARISQREAYTRKGMAHA